MPAMQLVLVRSGLIDTEPGVLVGQSDPPLAVAGFTAMQQLAADWVGSAPRFLFSSGLKRARQGAQVFASHFALEPIADARLQPMDYGRWQGLSQRQAQDSDPEHYAAWRHHWWIQPAPGGECFGDVLRRTGIWLSALLRTAQADDVVLAVAHRDSIRALACHALGLPAERSNALRIDPAHVGVLRSTRDGFEVSCLNASSFQVLPA